MNFVESMSVFESEALRSLICIPWLMTSTTVVVAGLGWGGRLIRDSRIFFKVDDIEVLGRRLFLRWSRTFLSIRCSCHDRLSICE